MIMSSQRIFRATSSHGQRAESEPALSSSIDAWLEVERASSAPARMIYWTEGTSLQQSGLGEEQEARKAQNQRSGYKRGSRIGLRQSSASTKPPLPSITTQGPVSRKRPASTSPEPSDRLSGQHRRERDVIETPKSARHNAASAKDHAESTVEVSERPALAQEGDTPSKHVKSDIAPWMTQRHKAAIRRSLAGAASTVESLMKTSSPSKGAASLDEREEARDA